MMSDECSNHTVYLMSILWEYLQKPLAGLMRDTAP
jgi:hypothetical protein